jgi:hypothetical protein
MAGGVNESGRVLIGATNSGIQAPAAESIRAVAPGYRRHGPAPCQLGYESFKFISRLTVTDSLKYFGKGPGPAEAGNGYAWCAGI